MTDWLALLSSDGSLLGCHVRRVLEGSPEPEGRAAGAACFDNGRVLVRKRPPARRASLEQMLEGVSSECLLAVWPEASRGYREEDAPPFRFRAWAWADNGAAGRDAAGPELPEYLRRAAAGRDPAEPVFLSAMGRLHGERVIDDPDIAAARAADALAATLHEGGPHAPLTAVLGNGRVLAAVRLGGAPLHYRLFEGSERCARCGLPGDGAAPEAQVRRHRAVRLAALATRVADEAAWTQVPDRHVVTISRGLEVRVTAL